ncbi:MAG: glycosyltransferase [Acetobacteraceae bacterium]|nr:glycosyltransferase [Acetobacteraceae bacterium]MBV8590414.1 glycosyltransferase [Acetobacteraceae bacterium]
MNGVAYVAGAPSPPNTPYDADVIILALDRPRETVQAICSALRQTGVSHHIFVLDQGSAPANLHQLARFVAQQQGVTLFRVAHNRGVAGGRNCASALGHGRVILGLDNDAEFATADAVARAVAAIDADPDLAAIGFRIVAHATGIDDLSSWGYPKTLLEHAAGVFEAATFIGAGHAIRRAAWHQAGRYDEALFFCWEEFDFSLRAINLGWRVRYHGDIVVRHKVSRERRQEWSGERWFFSVRNRLYIARKWGAPWISLAPRYAGYLLKGLLRGTALQTIRALPAAIRLSASIPVGELSSQARIYLRRHDKVHRGSPLLRIRHELFGRLS